MERKCHNKTQIWHFLLSLVKEAEEDDTILRKKVKTTLILEAGFRHIEKITHNHNTKYHQGEPRTKRKMELRHVKFVVGTIMQLLSIFIGGISLIKLQINFHKHLLL